jgi:hypothetical protein
LFSAPVSGPERRRGPLSSRHFREDSGPLAEAIVSYRGDFFDALLAVYTL